MRHSELTTAFAQDNLVEYAPPYAKMQCCDQVQLDALIHELPNTQSLFVVALLLASENINPPQEPQRFPNSRTCTERGEVVTRLISMAICCSAID